MSFNNTQPCCPVCPVDRRRNRIALVEVENNYSGSGMDVGQCPQCKRVYGVHYYISKVERMKSWEVEPIVGEDNAK